VPDLGRGGASRAFELARRYGEREGLAEINHQLRAEGYSEFAIQLFEPSMARLIRQGLIAPQPPRAVRPASGWRVWSKRLWAKLSRGPKADSMEAQLSRRVDALFAARRG